MKNYTVRVWTVTTVVAKSIDGAETEAVKQVVSQPEGCLWGATSINEWSEDETLEDIERDIQDQKNRQILKLEDARSDKLLPLSWVYLYQGSTLYVARIGQNNDWAAYQGPSVWGVEGVAQNGYKLTDKEALPLFPVCSAGGLTYRL